MQTPLDGCRYWFLESLIYEDLGLAVVIVEGLVAETEDIQIRDVTIKGSSQIEPTPQSRRLRISFFHAPSFRVTDEVVRRPEPSGEPSLLAFREYQESEFLISCGFSFKGKLRHFGIITEDRIIDVLSAEPPTFTELPDGV